MTIHKNRKTGSLRQEKREDALSLTRAQPAHHSVMLCGGRMTKVAGVAASLAPMLGTLGVSVSAIALGTTFVASPALAGDCADTAGTFVCSGPADPATDTTQVLQPTGALEVVTDPDFGIDTSTNGGNAFTLGNSVDTTSINFQDPNGASIIGANSGIVATNLGAATTDLTINTSGSVEGLTGQGIEVDNRGTGSTSITANNVTSGAGDGIKADHAGSGDLTITAADVTGEESGIDADNSGSGGTSITADNVTATAYAAIYAFGREDTASISVTTSGTVESANRDGIFVRHQGSGDVTITATNADGTAQVSGALTGIFVNHSGIYADGNTSITVDNVTATLGAGIRTQSSLNVTEMSIKTSGTVLSTNGDGIDAMHVGSGDLIITATNDAGDALVSGGASGISAQNANGGALKITADNVTATDSDAVDVKGYVNTTYMSITTNGTVRSTYGDGIDAEHYGSGDLTITAADVIAGERGIAVNNSGDGATSITADNVTGPITDDNVTGTNGDAINASGGANTTSMSITTSGTVLSTNEDGIEARHAGSGDLTITATNADGTAQVTGGRSGINARNEGTGSTFITANNVTGGPYSAILALNASSTDALSITADGLVKSTIGNGISADQFGSGDLTITSTNANEPAQIHGASRGVSANNSGDGATVLSFNSVSGGTRSAVYASNYRTTTALTITADGLIKSESGDGIEAIQNGSGDLTITAADVEGGKNGIVADNKGDGATIVTADNITAGTGDGVDADGDPSTTSLSITTTGTVRSTNGVGIDAFHLGSGALTITAINDAGDASVTGNNNGIFANSFSSTTSQTIVTNSVTGTGSSADGIDAQHAGSGDLTITSTNADSNARVEGTVRGIYARNTGIGSTSITVNNAEGGTGAGIFVRNFPNAGPLSITADGIVESTSSVGLSANHNGRGDLTISVTNSDGTAAIIGQTEGLFANNTGNGATSITADNVRATDDDAIYASGGEYTTYMSITASGTVESTYGDGIDARHEGTGDLTITTADVIAGQKGIIANNTGDGATSITADNVTGPITDDNVTGTNGDAINASGGADTTFMSITTNGTVQSTNGSGIDASHAGSGNLTITATNADDPAQVTGGTSGIDANNTGTGSTFITANNVTGGSGAGINASTSSDTGALSITADGLVQSTSAAGINTLHLGSGDLTIAATKADGTAQVKGETLGVNASNFGDGATVLSLNSVSGNTGSAVFAVTGGMTTDLTITANGTIESTLVDGIEAVHQGSGDLTITAAEVIGGANGIEANNSGSGATSITADSVTATNGDGIEASGGANTTSMSITTSETVESTYGNGIEAIHGGSGDLTITATQVTGGPNGIVASNTGDGATSITADNVSATDDNASAPDGYAINASGGADTTFMSITTNGTVESIIGDGINASHAGSGDLTITAADVIGGGNGIEADNSGSGATSITTENVTATDGDAIDASNGGNTTSMSITTTGTVQSTNGDGIDAEHYGSGDLTITATNAAGDALVDGGSNGLLARNEGTGATVVALNSVSGGTGGAAVDVRNASTTTALTITADGLIESEQGDGVFVRHAGSGDLSVTVANASGTGQVIGSQDGIETTNTGTGSTSIAADNAAATNGTGINVTGGANTTFLSITANGTVRSTNGDGIDADHAGSGDLTITAADVIGGENGIIANNTGDGATSITADNVTGPITDDNVTGTNGDAINASGGADTTFMSITTNGTVQSTNGIGIAAVHEGSGDLTITATDVIGGENGIITNNTGDGATSITVENVTATNRDAINASHAGSGDLTITSTNSDGTAQVSGGVSGLVAVNAGTGSTSVAANNVSGGSYAGILAYNTADAGALSITTDGIVQSTNNNGIVAAHFGNGDLTITSTNADGSAQVSGVLYGVAVFNRGTGSTTLSLNSVSGGTEDAVLVQSYTTTADLTITANSTVESAEGHGIQANHAGSGDLTITATNADGSAQVTANEEGIEVLNVGTGATSIAADNVMATNGDAIAAAGFASTTSMSITTSGTVQSINRNGIYAGHYGSGNLTITATNAEGDALVSGGDTGINAFGTASTTALTITANSVTGTSGDGINASHEGSGDLTITATNAAGDALVSGGQGGINANNQNGGALSITADNVEGVAGAAINATNDAAGTGLSITASGIVESADYVGIFATQSGSGDLTITAADVIGGENGIEAINTGDGATSITADNVTATDAGAINATGGANTTSMSISIGGTVRSTDGNGINTSHAGSGDLTITTSGTVQSTNGDAINASRAGSGDLTITSTNSDGSAQVSGGVSGVFAFNTGTGSTSVAANNVSGGSYAGILAYNTANAGALSITTDGIVESASYVGIRATQDGSGDLTVTASNSDGTAQVNGGVSGLFLTNFGSGATAVSLNSVSGGTGDAVFVSNSSTTTDLSISADGAIESAQGDGVEAVQLGSGDLTIAVTNADGTAQVTADEEGIQAINYGTGATSITVDNVTTTDGDAIYANSGDTTTSMSITASGTVQSTNADGIDARHAGSGDLTIMSGNADGTAQVSGGTFGLNATNAGSGATAVSLNSASGGTGDAVFVQNAASTTALSITADGTISSASANGIEAIHAGSGDLTITVTSASDAEQTNAARNDTIARNTDIGATSVTADSLRFASSAGVAATKAPLAVATSAAIQSANANANANANADADADGGAHVTGGAFGIYARNTGAGSTFITADNVTGMANDAINASNGASAAGLSILTTGTVVGGEDGIEASNSGTGPLVVTVSGVTTGTTGSGISTQTGAGGLSVITLNAGANVSGGEFAIFNDDGDSATFFNTGSTVSGVTQLGLGSDNLTIADADISGATVLDGGDVSDGTANALSFAGFAGSFSADLLNWEEVVFDNSQATFAGSSITTAATRLQNGTTFAAGLPGFALNSALSIDRTSTFFAGLGGAGNVTINGDVANAGLISAVDNAAGDRITINGNLTGIGILALDVDVAAASADTISITGDAIGTGLVVVNGFGLGTTPSEITLLDVSGATDTGAFGLASTNFTLPNGEDAQIIGAFGYQLRFDAQSQTFFISPFSDDGSSLLFNPATIPLEAYPAQLTLLNTPGTTFQTWGNRPSVSQEATSGEGRKSVAQSLIDFDLTLDKALWISFNGTRAAYEGQSTLGSDVDTNVFDIEVGFDMPVYESDSSRLLLGTSFAWQDADTDIDGQASLAGIDTQAASFTLSALWLSSSQFYANGQIRYSTFSSDFSVDGLGRFASNADGDGMAVSMEVGKVFDLSDGLTLVPQVQFIHSAVSSDGIADPFGSPFAAFISDGETTSARAGLMAEHVTGSASLMGSVSYIHAFDNDTAIDFAGTPFITSLGQSRVELSAGAQVSVAKNLVLHGALTAQGAIADFSNDNSYGVTGGVRFNF